MTKEEQREIFMKGKTVDPRDVTATQFLGGLGDDPNDMSPRAVQARAFKQQTQLPDENTVRGKQAVAFFQSNLPNPNSYAGKQAEDFIGRAPMNQADPSARVFMGEEN